MGHRDVILWLLNAGADVNQASAAGETAYLTLFAWWLEHEKRTWIRETPRLICATVCCWTESWKYGSAARKCLKHIWKRRFTRHACSDKRKHDSSWTWICKFWDTLFCLGLSFTLASMQQACSMSCFTIQTQLVARKHDLWQSRYPLICCQVECECLLLSSADYCTKSPSFILRLVNATDCVLPNGRLCNRG